MESKKVKIKITDVTGKNLGLMCELNRAGAYKGRIVEGTHREGSYCVDFTVDGNDCSAWMGETCELVSMVCSTEYYIDYIYNNPSGANFYHQLVRTKDEAILYANPNLDYVKLECWKRGISINQVTIL